VAAAANLLGLAMQFLGVAERGRASTMRRCVLALPRLGELAAGPLVLASQRGDALQPCRDMVLELSVASAIEQLAALLGQRPNLSVHEDAARRRRMHRLLRRLSLGRSVGFSPALGPLGEVLAGLAEMAYEFRRLWGDEYAQRLANRDEFEQWIVADSTPRPPRAEEESFAVMVSFDAGSDVRLYTFKERGLRFMLLAGARALMDVMLTRRALLFVASYLLRCQCRRRLAFSNPEVPRRAFNQAVKDAAQGHVGALRALDNMWADDDPGS
ncbi:unnamed protein product, partial [Prorocentrum cordatum]